MSESTDVVRRYLPAEFVARIPPADLAWRGRTILLLWVLGYSLQMAWCLGMVDEPEQVRFYRDAMADCDNARLAADLDATAASRGDARHLTFAWLGPVEVLVRE